MDANLAAHILFQRYFNKVFHRFISPSLGSFARYPILSDTDVTLKKIMVTDAIPHLEKIREEYKSISLALNERYKSVHLKYPLEFAIETLSSYFLYLLVRLTKPSNIVETGVANGHSSYFLLNALLENECGTLHSFDVKNNVGTLISEKEKKMWDLNILPRGHRKSFFQDRMKKLGGVDLFIHDSNHFYYWQVFEYRTAWEMLKKGGFLLSDDTDASYAFLDFSKEISTNPIFISDSRKMFGVLVKGSK